MKIIKKLIKLHRLLFMAAALLTFLTAILSVWWNKFLAEMLNFLEEAVSFGSGGIRSSALEILPAGIFVILLQILSEYLSSCISSYTCEIFAHDMRMGYARYYLQSDIRMLSKLNVGEEQSAMQNELKEISDYLHENLFPIMKQFATFMVTVVFLLCQNLKLAVISIVPVIPLIFYCAFSSRAIKAYTRYCQEKKKKMNGVAELILDLFPVIQVYGACKLVKNMMGRELTEWEKANVKKERVCARLMSLSGVLSFVALLLLLGAGGFMAINKEITTGTFYIFINLSGNVSGFLQNMPGIYAAFRQFDASIQGLEGKLVLERV